MSQSDRHESTDDLHAADDDQAAELVEAGPPAAAADEFEAQRAALAGKGKIGANWFYWVAGLSLVNSAIFLFGGGIQFVVGLATTQIVDGLAEVAAVQFPDAALIIRAVALVLSVGIAAIAVGFGWLANRRYIAAFIIGMGLYVLDALLCLLFQDWKSAAFHGLGLYGMWSGLSAFRELQALENQVPQGAGSPAVEMAE